MSETWRFIDNGAVDAPVMFGRMPVLAATVATGGPQIVMTGVFGRGHFQIGWFEDVDAVVDLDAARAEGIEVFRRPLWGGGAAFYDSGASAFFSFFIRDDAFATLDAALGHFKPAMREALDAVGLDAAEFEGASDIRWHGRKLGTLIAQSVLGTKVVGGFLNLRKPDLGLYAKVARVPEEKFKDKIIKDAVAYICTPSEVRGSDLPYEELRDAVVRCCGLPVESVPIQPEEEAQVAGFVGAVGADDWVRRVSASRFVEAAEPGNTTGFANVKAKKLVRAGVEMRADGTIARAMIAGDMHVSPPDAIDKVAATVAGDLGGLTERVRAAFDGIDQPDETAGITPEDVVQAVVLAAEAAS